MNFSNYIHKSWHRIQLEKYLIDILPKLGSPALDIGSKNRRYDHLFKVRPTAIDIVENIEKEVLGGNVNELRFADGSFEAVVCLEVLEYVDDIKKSVGEIYRVLNNGGEAVISIPFMYKIHKDKMRYTEEYLKDIFSLYFSSVEVLTIGNFYTIILDTIRNKIMMVGSKTCKFLLYLPYLFLIPFVPIFRKSIDRGFVSGYLILAKK